MLRLAIVRLSFSESFLAVVIGLIICSLIRLQQLHLTTLHLHNTSYKTPCVICLLVRSFAVSMKTQRPSNKRKCVESIDFYQTNTVNSIRL